MDKGIKEEIIKILENEIIIPKTRGYSHKKIADQIFEVIEKNDLERLAELWDYKKLELIKEEKQKWFKGLKLKERIELASKLGELEQRINN